jgi:hypothetical protein
LLSIQDKNANGLILTSLQMIILLEKLNKKRYIGSECLIYSLNIRYLDKQMNNHKIWLGLEFLFKRLDFLLRIYIEYETSFLSRR